MKNANAAAALATALALALVPLVAAQSGGGTITNQAPTITTGLSGDKGTQANLLPVTETFTFTAFDANGEADIQQVRIESTDPTFGARTCSSPFTSCTGWTMDNPAPDDGSLAFTFTYTWPANQAIGTHTQVAAVRDEGSFMEGSTPDATTFTGQDLITPDSNTFNNDGTPDGRAWGAWNATAAATLVDSVNLIKATNAGTGAGTITVTFGSPAFAGPSASIAIDGNLRFRSGFGATPATASMSLTPVDGDGTYTFTIPAASTIWIGYQIQAMPAILPDATYSSTFTFA